MSVYTIDKCERFVSQRAGCGKAASPDSARGVRPQGVREQIELYLEQVEEASEEERGYMRKKVKDIAAHEEEIDAMINEHTTGWKTGRMNKVDLSVLRLAVYEMKWDDEVPVKVAINEAVELAKNFSGDEGPAFVNGVLGKLA